MNEIKCTKEQKEKLKGYVESLKKARVLKRFTDDQLYEADKSFWEGARSAVPELKKLLGESSVKFDCDNYTFKKVRV